MISCEVEIKFVPLGVEFNLLSVLLNVFRAEPEVKIADLTDVSRLPDIPQTVVRFTRLVWNSGTQTAETESEGFADISPQSVVQHSKLWTANRIVGRMIFIEMSCVFVMNLNVTTYLTVVFSFSFGMIFRKLEKIE